MHPSETDWIKKNAAKYAAQLCNGCKPTAAQIEAATAALTREALKEVDFVWRSGLTNGEDATAAAFLAAASGTFINEIGKQQQLFTVEHGQFFAAQQGLWETDSDFIRKYGTSGITRNIYWGALQEAKELGASIGSAYARDPLKFQYETAKGVLSSAVNGILHPLDTLSNVKDGFVSNSKGIGEAAAAVVDSNARDHLNKLYGQDVTAAVGISGVVGTVTTVGTAVGAGKLASATVQVGTKVAVNAAEQGAINAIKDAPKVVVDAALGGKKPNGGSGAQKPATPTDGVTASKPGLDYPGPVSGGKIPDTGASGVGTPGKPATGSGTTGATAGAGSTGTGIAAGKPDAGTGVSAKQPGEYLDQATEVVPVQAYGNGANPSPSLGSNTAGHGGAGTKAPEGSGTGGLPVVVSNDDVLALGQGPVDLNRVVVPNTTPQLSPRIDISDHFVMTPKGGEVRLRYRAEVDADMHYLDATVNRDGILGFDISAQGNRELYGSGKDMFYSLMNRLEREGIEVKGVRGQWYDGQGSDNYAQFRNLLDQKMSPADAALNTWTGKRAQEFGFSSPIKINDYGTDVQVVFGREP